MSENVGRDARDYFARHGLASLKLVRREIESAFAEGDEARALDLDNFLVQLEEIMAANDDQIGLD